MVLFTKVFDVTYATVLFFVFGFVFVHSHLSVHIFVSLYSMGTLRGMDFTPVDF